MVVQEEAAEPVIFFLHMPRWHDACRPPAQGYPMTATAPLPSAPKCPICGGTVFGPGPKGRTSPNGAMPRCAGCQSLERHRIFRIMFDKLGPQGLRRLDRDPVQPGPDRRSSWFASHELSVYGEPGGLDIQAIDRPDAAYDIAICSHVLEHVGDDRAALHELLRIIKPDGLLYLAFPDPFREEVTRDWGFPEAGEAWPLARLRRGRGETFRRIYPRTARARLSRAGPGDRRMGRRFPAAALGGAPSLDRRETRRFGQPVFGAGALTSLYICGKAQLAHRPHPCGRLGIGRMRLVGGKCRLVRELGIDHDVDLVGQRVDLGVHRHLEERRIGDRAERLQPLADRLQILAPLRAEKHDVPDQIRLRRARCSREASFGSAERLGQP